MKKNILLVIALTTVIFISCKKNDSNVTPVNTTLKIDTVKNLIADSVIGIGPYGPYGYGKYTFFSLRTNSIVPNADSLSTNWDLAFKGTTIKINGGTSGFGNGGAYVYTGLFSSLSTIDGNLMKKDTTGTNAILTGPGNGWYNSEPPPVNLINPIPGRVLAIRTADGKYAKIEILNYYKGGVTPASNASDSIKGYDSRHYTFRYTYQPNGTTNF